MELEGLKRALKKIQDYNITINALVTDLHQQSKWLRETQANVKHYYDVWHLAKGIYHPLMHAYNIFSRH